MLTSTEESQERSIIEVLTSREDSQERSIIEVLTSREENQERNIMDVLTPTEESQERSIIDVSTSREEGQEHNIIGRHGKNVIMPPPPTLYEGTLGSISLWVLTRGFEGSLYTKVTFQYLFKNIKQETNN